MRFVLGLVLLLMIGTPNLAVAQAAGGEVSATAFPEVILESEEGQALRYPPRPGGQTASGDIYSPERFTVAHRWLPFGTLVQLTHPRTGATVTARVNDRDTGGALVRVSARAADHLGLPAGGGAIVLQLEPSEVAYLRNRAARERSRAQREAVASREENFPTVAATSAEGPGAFTVQLGSFSDESRAAAAAAALRGAWIAPVELEGRRVWRVYYGRYPTREAASAHQERLQAQGISGFVKGIDS